MVCLTGGTSETNETVAAAREKLRHGTVNCGAWQARDGDDFAGVLSPQGNDNRRDVFCCG